MEVLTVTEKEIQMVMNALNGYPTVCKSTVVNKIQAILRKHEEKSTSETNVLLNNRCFYQVFRNGAYKKTALVIETDENGITRFKTRLIENDFEPAIIAESENGTGGCWRNFYKNICPDLKESVYKMPWEEGFNCWLLSHFGFRVSYYDNLVVVLEKEEEFDIP